MFRDGGNFGWCLKISSFSYNAKYWVWKPKRYSLAMLHFTSILHMHESDLWKTHPGDLGSIPGRVIPKTFKMVLDTSLLNIQQYKVRIAGKVEQSRERSSALSYTSVHRFWKGSLRVALDYGHQLYFISSLVISRSTFHFNTCVCWLEIHVRITRVTIGTFFYITVFIFIVALITLRLMRPSVFLVCFMSCWTLNGYSRLVKKLSN